MKHFGLHLWTMVNSVLRAIVAAKLWLWFVVSQFGFEPISPVVFFGLFTLQSVVVLPYSVNARKVINEPSANAVETFFWTVLYCLVLFEGYIAHLVLAGGAR